MPSHPAETHTRTAFRCACAAVAAIVAFVSLALWSREVWLRPQVFSQVHDLWLAGVAVTATVAAAIVLPIAGKWWLRTAAALVATIAFIIIGQHIRNATTVQHLLTHEEKHDARMAEWRMPELVPDRWRHIRPVLDWLESRGLPVPGKPSPFDREIPPHIHNHKLEWLLGTCDWPVRREFMQRMITDENRAELLFLEWARIFPVVTGQDVTLANRLEMLDWLAPHSANPNAAPATRHAATLWMALIILTDPESFADWRAPVRDRLLAADDPPFDPDGDVWMRALDLLLAMDPPDDAVALTRALLDDPQLMRRALRERVRGLEGHAATIFDEIERINAAGDPHAAAAMWVDLKHLAERIPDASKRTEIQIRMTDTLVEWLADDSSQVIDRFSQRINHAQLGMQDLWVELTTQQRARLQERVDEALHNRAHPLRMLSRQRSLPQPIEHALMIRPFLDHEDPSRFAEQIAAILMNQDWQAEPEPDLVVLDTPRLLVFSSIWDDLSEATRQRAADWIRWNLVTFPAYFSHDHHFMNFLSSMDEAHPYLGLGDVERLAFTFTFSLGHPRTRRDLRWTLVSNQEYEPPHFSAAAIEEFLTLVDQALATGRDRIPTHLAGEPLAIEPRRSRSLRALSRNTHARDEVIFQMVAYGQVAPEDWSAHLTGSLQMAWEDAMGHGGHAMHAMRTTLFARWYDDVEQVDAAFNAPIPPYWHGLSQMLDHLAVGTPNEAVLRRLDSHFTPLVQFGDIGHVGAHVLLRIEEKLEPTRRDEIREVVRQNFGSAYRWLGRPPLFFEVGLGMQPARVAWRDDALSAEHGWASHVFAELNSWWSPPFDNSGTQAPTFAYLKNCREPSSHARQHESDNLDRITPARAWRAQPPAAPLQATPWQRARDIHLRRPDLHFPDHTEFRPPARPR